MFKMGWSLNKPYLFCFHFVMKYLYLPRIIYTRFHTKSSVLLRRVKNQNIEAEIQKLIVETLGPLQGKHEVFKDGAIKWRLPLFESMELEMYIV